MTVFAISVDHHHGFKPIVQAQRFKLNHVKLAHSLKQASIAANIHRSFSTPCLSLAREVEEAADSDPRVEIVGSRRAPGVHVLVVEAAIAMASGVNPVPVSSGLGGAYYLRNRTGENVVVAKPIDEEPFAINNPKGFVGRILGQPGLKRSIRVGETGVREVAAYLLDHGGFAGVPPTALVKISHAAFHVNTSSAMTVPLPKIVSLQRFIDHDSDASDLGTSGFSVSSIHRIGILDIRLLNLDRHAGNILVKRYGHENYNNGRGGYGCYDSYVNESSAVGAAELVPIDHGFCLPETLDDPYFEWLHWPQASVPFSESEVVYIDGLDPLKDAELLRTELPSLRESSIRILVLCTIFLKCATGAGLCLADIGDMMTREFCGREESLSVLESLCAIAMGSIDNTFEDDHSKEENNEEMFQFDVECEESNANLMDLPLLLQSTTKNSMKPPIAPKKVVPPRSMSGFPQEILSTLYEEKYDDNAKNKSKDDKDGTNEKGDDNDDNKVVGLMKSMSFSITNANHETRGISFGGMSEEEWELFLESFVELLPQVFEGRKSMGMKQRLGTSCKF